MAGLSDKKRRRKYIRWLIILLIIVIVVGFRLVEEIGRDVSPDDRFVIVRIIDGDTVELAGGDKLRLLAIDTPEKNEPYYEAAKLFLDSLTKGKTAEIKYGTTRRDRYGRLLGFLYIDTIFINKVIIENGLGYLYLFKDQDLKSPQIKEILEAQRKALAEKRGIWSVTKEPEDFYVNLVGSLRFHRPSCRSVQGSDPAKKRIFQTREEALYEGLSPCRNCKP